MKNSKGYEENLYTPRCIRTFTGIYVDIENPTPGMFCIEDIAHALSQIPRFGGHLPVFYSVAEHSISCALMARNEGETKQNIFNALMHDCSEAYLGDIVSPIKAICKDYKKLEIKIMTILAKKFNFDYGMFGLTTYTQFLDRAMLEHEWNAFFLNKLNNQRNMNDIEIEFLTLFAIYNPLR